ncbi:MAG: hypothetical protein KF680_06345 [Cryobacterium sp.]|nr:hypothetical protein [Cryobacterium sp.]
MAAVDDDDIQDLLDQIRAATAQIRSTTRATQDEAARERAENAEEREGLEAERRDGEHGRDWQVLQERIDLKKTTQADILNGVDTSPEAQSVRRVVGTNLAKAKSEVPDILDDSKAEFAELRHAQEQLARTAKSLRDFHGSL